MVSGVDGRGLCFARAAGRSLRAPAITQISFLVAVIWLSAGILRLGFLARFLSHSVISGFTTGAACIIGLSQLKYAFGVKVPQSDTALEILIELGKAIDGFQWREFIMFVAWFALLLAIKTTAKRIPRLRWIRPLGPLTVLILAIVIVVVGDLDGKELIKTVSSVPKGAIMFALLCFHPVLPSLAHFLMHLRQ